MMDEVTRRVRSLYEAYPYPERMPGGASDAYLDMLLAFTEQPPQRRCSFLDAGCGTGVNLLGAAMLYPHFDVYGCDLNRVALSAIENDLREHGLHNVELRELDLVDLPEEFGPPQGFDVIYCTGVLHHLVDPRRALRRLADRLAPQGVLRLMVYSEQGRVDLYRFARVAQRLWPEQKWGNDRLQLARALMAELERQPTTPPPLRGTWSDALTAGDAEFADRYLHPHDHPYSPAALRELLESCQLRVLDWFEPRDWQLESLLPEFAASPDAPREFWERVELIDQLFERPKFDLYLVGPEFRERHAVVSEETLLSTSPQLFLEQVTVRGNPLAQAARLRLGEIEPLSRSEGRLLAALGRRFASLAELHQEWGELLGASALEEAEGLLRRGFLYAPHAPAAS